MPEERLLNSVAPNDLPEDILKYCYHRVTDKSIADATEALLGAYLIAGGMGAGFSFLDWLGIKRDRVQSSSSSNDVEMSSCSVSKSQSQCSLMSMEEQTPLIDPLLLQHSTYVFSSYCPPPPSSMLENCSHKASHIPIVRMLSVALPGHSGESLCEKLRWDFNDRATLLQALTHQSYSKNRFTRSYQRLEFLGDAVLDYLITCCLYSEFPNYTPGQITETRSALVNNITFAEIAVRELSLHTYLLYLAPSLFRKISEYVELLLEEDHGEERSQEEVFYCQFSTAKARTACKEQ